MIPLNQTSIKLRHFGMGEFPVDAAESLESTPHDGIRLDGAKPSNQGTHLNPCKLPVITSLTFPAVLWGRQPSIRAGQQQHEQELPSHEKSSCCTRILYL
jgi:hypothetical protein